MKFLLTSVSLRVSGIRIFIRQQIRRGIATSSFSWHYINVCIWSHASYPSNHSTATPSPLARPPTVISVRSLRCRRRRRVCRQQVHASSSLNSASEEQQVTTTQSHRLLTPQSKHTFAMIPGLLSYSIIIIYHHFYRHSLAVCSSARTTP